MLNYFNAEITQKNPLNTNYTYSTLLDNKNRINYHTQMGYKEYDSGYYKNIIDESITINDFSESNESINDKINEFIENNTHNTRNIHNISHTNDILIKKKKKIIESIKLLSNIEHIEIFNILKNDNCPHSENVNGVFINLTNVKENTINRILQFIEYTQSKKEELQNIDKNIEKILKTIDTTANNFNNIIFDNNVACDNNKHNNNIIKSCTYQNVDLESKGNILELSSDSDEAKEGLENKLSLKKKKNKYTGKKAQLIKSYKNNNTNTKKSQNTPSDNN